MDTSNRIIAIIVGVVVLTGVLSGGAALWHTQRLSSSYDEALKTELEQKALAYSTTATAFLNALGPDGFAVLEGLVLEGLVRDTGDTTPDPPAPSASQFTNAFQSFEVWLPDESSSMGYTLLTRQELLDDVPPASLRAVETLIEDATANGGTAAAIDEKAQLILASIPISLDEETIAIGIGTLAANDEFAFFAAQRQDAIRDGITLSAGIVALVVLVGTTLGTVVLRQRSRADAALRDSEATLRATLESSTDGILVVRDDWQIAYVNERFVEMWGLGSLISRTRDANELLPVALLQVHNARAVETRIREAFFSPESTNETLRLKDRRVIEMMSVPLMNGDRVARRVVSMKDVTERVYAEEDLRERVRRDPLTGVLNHGAIVEELRNLLESSGDADTHAVAMVDVDDLKVVNDSHGHQLGDAILVAIASGLSKEGAIVGRYGGDEFVVILPNADRPAAERYRADVIETLEGSSIPDSETGVEVPPAVSIGLAVYPQEAATVADLVRLSDSAMYAAKRERPAGSAGAPDRPFSDDKAAKLVREVTPLLTAPGELTDKLRLVADRVSSDCGYDGSTFMLYASAERDTPLSGSTFVHATREQAESWIHEYRQRSDEPVRWALDRGRQPINMEDPQHDPILTDSERNLVRKARIRSLLVVPIIWEDEVIGSLTVVAKRAAAFGPRDADLVGAVANQVPAFIRMAALVDELQTSSARLVRAQDDTVLLLAAAAEAHDETTGLHLRGVRSLAEELARELGYQEEDAASIAQAAVLHDVGKFRVPDTVLANTDGLNDEAWEQMKQHTVWGGRFLAGRPGFELAATVARAHHERWDGTGYPDGLAADAIPEGATIVAVADAFDAITHNRPYRGARPEESAVAEIKAHSGKQFSPRIVDALLRLYERDELPQPTKDAPHQDAA